MNIESARAAYLIDLQAAFSKLNVLAEIEGDRFRVRGNHRGISWEREFFWVGRRDGSKGYLSNHAGSGYSEFIEGEVVMEANHLLHVIGLALDEMIQHQSNNSYPHASHDFGHYHSYRR